MTVPPDDPRPQARIAVQREPGNAMAWIVLSDVELEAGDARAGARAAQHALKLVPGHPEALARLGRGLWMLGRHAEAADSLRAAARQAPNHPGIAVWLAHAQEDAGEAEAANDSYARAHTLLPQHPQIAAYLLAWRRRLCDWRDLDRLSRQVREAVRTGQDAIEPFAFLSEDAGAAEQLACARLRARDVAARVRPLPPVPAPAEGPLRMGFLSNGFGAHPTGLLTAAFFESLSAHGDIRTHLFALNRDDGSATRRRLQQAAYRLHDVSAQAHAAIARHIRDTGVEILFDLRGWGGGGRPEVLAMRPAPVQVNWLAYPGTSGAPWIDYVLADPVVLPDALAPHFSEAVARLPRCFQPSDTRRAIPPAPPRAACGLPDAGVVFCCFNNSYKLNPASFARLTAVLRGVPGSVLWLLSGPGEADRRLRDVAQAAGIDPARLVFMPKQPQAEYLARLQLADLFLDCNPYNAHTTASDALWAGCPVLTRPGDTFTARVAASLNHHLGLGHMNMADDDRFIARAIALGNDPDALRSLRAEVVRQRDGAGLFDMDAFAGDFLAIARQMSDRHRAGLPPHPSVGRVPTRRSRPTVADLGRRILSGFHLRSCNRYAARMSASDEPIPLSICVLTVSDSRTPETDSSGDYLVEALQAAGHRLAGRSLLPDDRYRLRAQVSQWIADPAVDGILVTGGTGFTGRDSTPEALLPLLDKEMPGFGELFRAISFEEIGTSSLQSRAFAGLANGSFVFCLPGSTSACRTAWERIIHAQLDARTRPCNLATLRPRLKE